MIPLPTQLQFISSRSKKRAFIGGFGCGKTTTGARLAAQLALCHPGSRGLVAGVSYVRHVKDVIVPEILKALDGVPGIKIIKHDRYLDIIINKYTKLQIGNEPWVADRDYTSKILFYGIGRSGDELAFRSEEFDWAWVDEAVVCNEQAFKFIPTRLNRSKSKGCGLGLFYVTTTPDEPSHWLKSFLDDQSFEISTMKTDENTHLTDEYIRERHLQYSGAFALRYLEGLWVTVDNAMFNYSGLQYIDSTEVPRDRMEYVAACDPATSKTGDYFVIAVLGKLPTDPKVYLVDLICERGVPVLQQVELLERTQNRYNPKRFVVETVAYQDSLRQLVERRIPHILGIKPESDKVIRAMQLSACWQNKNFIIGVDLNRKNIENQFLGFPSGEHDDIVDACAYAYKFLNQRTIDPLKYPITSKYSRY